MGGKTVADYMWHNPFGYACFACMLEYYLLHTLTGMEEAQPYTPLTPMFDPGDRDWTGVTKCIHILARTNTQGK
jgi:hypothetical protein